MKLFLWGVVIVALGYTGYSGMLAASSWLKLHTAVDEIVSRDGVEAVPARELKSRVMTAATDMGVPLNERDVIVTNDGRVTIEVSWTIPVIVAKGEPVFAVPLSVRRSSAGRPMGR
jgi:hypothetical protein